MRKNKKIVTAPWTISLTTDSDRTGRECGADFRVEGDERLKIRRLVGGLAEPCHGRLQQPWNLGELETSGEEPLHRDFVGGDQCGRGPLPDQARLAGDPERRETDLVGRTEIETAGRYEIDRDGRRWAAFGVCEGVLDRKSHVRGAQLGLQGAVHEADGGMDDALRVDHHLDGVVVDIVQPVRLDHLQALVRERRRVDRDLGSHRPGRVAEGLLRAHGGEVRGLVEEGAAGRGQDERSDTGQRLADEALPDGRVLAVDRAEPGQRARERIHRAFARHPGCQVASQRHHEVAAGDERLLVGRSDDLARCERRDDRSEADDAARSDDDEVDVIAGRQRRQGVVAVVERRPGR